VDKGRKHIKCIRPFSRYGDFFVFARRWDFFYDGMTMIFFLHGADTFRSRQKRNQIIDKFTRERDPNRLNLQLLDGEGLTAETFSAAVSAAPFLADRRLVVVENLLTKNKSANAIAGIAQQVQTRIPESTILVMWEGELRETPTRKKAKPKATTKSKKTAAKAASDQASEYSKATLLQFLRGQQYAQEFSPLSPLELTTWIKNVVAERGGSIAPDALALLVTSVGNDLWALQNELDKLLMYAAGKPITKAAVTELVQAQDVDEAFALTEAISAGATGRALQLLNQQLRAGTSAQEVIGKIAWQLRTLLLVKDFIDRNGPGYPAERLGAQVGIHPFVARKAMSAVSRYSFDQLSHGYRQLAEADYTLKTKSVDAKALLSVLVAELG
jgi:DNA polymerase-3 subunit delta